MKNTLNSSKKIGGAELRLIEQAFGGYLSLEPDKASRVSQTNLEVKDNGFRRFEQDEAQVIKPLAASSSVSVAVFTRFHFDKTIVREAPSALSHSRLIQSPDCSIICATTF